MTRNSAAAWTGTTLALLLFASLALADSAAYLFGLENGPNGQLKVRTSVPTNQLYSLQSSGDLAHWHSTAGLATIDSSSGGLDLEPATNQLQFYRLARQSTMFRFRPDHVGVCDTDGLAGPNVSLKWQFKTADEVFASPAVIGGVVYIGSADTNFYAIDAQTGLEKWYFRTGGAIRSSAAVVDGTVYFSSRDALLYALRAADGTEVWRRSLGLPSQMNSVDDWDYFDSSPTVVDGVIYIGSGDGQLYAVDAATGQTNWTFKTNNKIRSSPAVVGGRVFFGNLDGYAYAVDATTGTNLWKFKTSGNPNFPAGQVFHSLTVSKGVVYFGCRDSALYAVNAVWGTQRWRTFVLNGVSWTFNTPAVWKDLVLAGTSIPGYLFALNITNGAVKWQCPTPSSLQEYSSPAIVDDIAYFGVGDALSTCTTVAHPRPTPAYLVAVNLTTGTEKWRFRVSGHVYSSPAVVDGTIYFGSLDGNVYAVH